MRKIFIGGNWKMQASSVKVGEIISSLNNASITHPEREIVVSPSFPFLSEVLSKIRKEIKVSAQNCCVEANGAFTGEVSAQMLKDIGLEWVILGHSERRQIFGETSEIVAKKVKLALSTGLYVIVCIGEKKDEREAGKTNEILTQQLNPLISSIQDWTHVVIAYEPVWAIGTGIVATPQQAQEAHAFIRTFLGEKIGKSIADSVRIIYGGSVNGKNSEDLFKQSEIDGFLVGGASITEDFIKIINTPKA